MRVDWERLDDRISRRRSRARPPAPCAAEALLKVAGEMRAITGTIADVLDYIESNAPVLRQAIDQFTIRGGNVTLVCRDSSGMFMLDRWLRSNRFALIASCRTPPRSIRVRSGGGPA